MMTNLTVKEFYKTTKIKACTMENLRWEKNMDRDCLMIQSIIITIKVNSYKTRKVDSESINLVIKNIKDIFKGENLMVTANLFIVTAIHMKEILWIIKNKAKENLY